MKVLLRIKKAPRYYILKSQMSLFGDTHPERVTVRGKTKTYTAIRHKKAKQAAPPIAPKKTKRDVDDKSYNSNGKAQWEYEDYSKWGRQMAKSTTLADLRKQLEGVEGSQKGAARSHLRAVERTTSMQSNSQGRAQSRNVLAGLYEERRALKDAIEIHENFPDKAKRPRKPIAEVPRIDQSEKKLNTAKAPTMSDVEYGKKAFEQGNKAPVLDKDFSDTLVSTPVGDKRTMKRLKDWQKGYTKAMMESADEELKRLGVR